MVARLSAAGLGLFAFAVAVIGGLIARNSFTVVLSRGILALFAFCLIGLVLGGAAQAVISEHAKRREEELRGVYRSDDETDSSAGSGEPLTGAAGEQAVRSA